MKNRAELKKTELEDVVGGRAIKTPYRNDKKLSADYAIMNSEIDYNAEQLAGKKKSGKKTVHVSYC